MPRGPGHLLPLHPMTVSDILDGPFRIWRMVLGPAVLLVLLVMAPYELISNLAISARAPEGFLQDGMFGPVELIDLATAGLVLLFGLIGILVWAFVATSVVCLVVSADRGGPRGVGPALRWGLRRSGVVLVDMLLLGLAAFVAMIVAVVILLIPFLGAIVMLFAGPIAIGVTVALGALVVPIAVVETGGPLAALGRAFWVLRVRFWRTIGVTWLVLIVLLGVSFGLSMVLEFVAAAAGPAFWVVYAVSNVVLSIVQVPFMALAALLIYLDARILREGFDLQVRISRLAAS